MFQIKTSSFQDPRIAALLRDRQSMPETGVDLVANRPATDRFAGTSAALPTYETPVGKGVGDLLTMFTRGGQQLANQRTARELLSSPLEQAGGEMGAEGDDTPPKQPAPSGDPYTDAINNNNYRVSRRIWSDDQQRKLLADRTTIKETYDKDKYAAEAGVYRGADPVLQAVSEQKKADRLPKAKPADTNRQDLLTYLAKNGAPTQFGNKDGTTRDLTDQEILDMIRRVAQGSSESKQLGSGERSRDKYAAEGIKSTIRTQREIADNSYGEDRRKALREIAILEGELRNLGGVTPSTLPTTHAPQPTFEEELMQAVQKNKNAQKR